MLCLMELQMDETDNQLTITDLPSFPPFPWEKGIKFYEESFFLRINKLLILAPSTLQESFAIDINEAQISLIIYGQSRMWSISKTENNTPEFYILADFVYKAKLCKSLIKYLKRLP